MIVKAVPKPTFASLWRTSTQFKVLLCTIPLTVLILILHILDYTSILLVSPVVLFWRVVLLIVLVRHRYALARRGASEQVPRRTRGALIWTCWNYFVLGGLTIAYPVIAILQLLYGDGYLANALTAGFAIVDSAGLVVLLTVVVFVDKRDEARLLRKTMGAGKIATAPNPGNSRDVEATSQADSLETLPPAYVAEVQRPVMCMKCACEIPHGDKVVIGDQKF